MRNTFVLWSTLVLLGGCVSSDPIVAPGPLFTDEEKDAMTTDEKLAVYNEQVEDGDRLICRREAPTGSRMHRTVCRSLREIRDERDQAQDDIDLVKKHDHVLPPWGDPPRRSTRR